MEGPVTWPTITFDMGIWVEILRIPDDETRVYIINDACYHIEEFRADEWSYSVPSRGTKFVLRSQDPFLQHWILLLEPLVPARVRCDTVGLP